MPSSSDLQALRHVELLRDGVPGTPVHQDHRHDRDGHSEVTQGSPDAPADGEDGEETRGGDSGAEEVTDEGREIKDGGVGGEEVPGEKLAVAEDPESEGDGEGAEHEDEGEESRVGLHLREDRIHNSQIGTGRGSPVGD